MTDIPSHQEYILRDVATGYTPGPDQFRSILHDLVSAGLITKTGMTVLDMGAGPEVRVPTYAVTLDGRALLDEIETTVTT